MSAPIRVAGFAGSLRRGSYNAAALRVAAELLPAGVTLEILDLATLPLYIEDLDGEQPDPVRYFKGRLAAAEALLIATPEYNYSVPGVLKNAIDWASRPPHESPLSGKPLAILGATTGPWGTIRAQLHLRQICVYTNMLPLNRPEVRIARAHEKFDAEGRLTDEHTRHEIGALLEALAAWTRQLRPHTG